MHQEDVWNQDETGCFYRALPEKTLAEKKKECKGGKKAKQRITISFFATAAGGKKFPVVIGHAAKPRCFKGISEKSKPHGIPYYSNKKAWMTSAIMEDILAKLNRKLVTQGRNILLLMDNAPSHSPTLRDKFSNIKVVFLAPNTTSRLQPLDTGIIKKFKVHYRRFLLRHVLASIDTNSDATATSVTKAVDVLMAIRWIKQAWNAVKSETIVNCFRHCGAVPSCLPSADEEDFDPFADIDSINELV